MKPAAGSRSSSTPIGTLARRRLQALREHIDALSGDQLRDIGIGNPEGIKQELSDFERLFNSGARTVGEDDEEVSLLFAFNEFEDRVRSAGYTAAHRREAEEALLIDEQDDRRETAISAAISTFQQRVQNLSPKQRAAFLADGERLRQTAYTIVQSSFATSGIKPTLEDFHSVIGLIAPGIAKATTFVAGPCGHLRRGLSRVGDGCCGHFPIRPRRGRCRGCGSGWRACKVSPVPLAPHSSRDRTRTNLVVGIGASVAAQVSSGAMSVEDALSVLDASVATLLTAAEIDPQGRTGMEFANFARSLAPAVAQDKNYSIGNALDDIRGYGQGLTEQRDRNTAERERAFARGGSAAARHSGPPHHCRGNPRA